ncbi:MFS transporter [Pirellulaceae bacterium SH467]
MDDATTDGSRQKGGSANRFSGQQWGILLVLAAIQFTHILDFVIVMPLGDQLRRQLHINPQQFGMIVSAYGIAAMVTGILSSAIVDSFDRKKVLVISFGCFVAATFYCGLAPGYEHLLAARSLTGMFGGLAASSVMAIIGDVFADRQRGKAIGVVTSSFAVASIVGLPIGLGLAILFRQWNAPFLGIGVLAVIVWGVAWVFLPALTSHRTEVRHAPISQFVNVVKEPNHVWAFAMMLTTVLGTFTIVPFIAPYLQANCGRSAEDLPVIYSVAGMFTLVSLNVIGWATDRFGAKPMFLVCAIGAVFMTLMITHLPRVSLGGAVVATSCFMVLASGRSVPAQAMMLQASNPRLRGAFMNLNSAVTHFGTAIGPAITGAIVGEDTAGGPLTHFGLAGGIAAMFGCAAVAISFKLKRFAEPLEIARQPFPVESASESEARNSMSS